LAGTATAGVEDAVDVIGSPTENVVELVVSMFSPVSMDMITKER
jgi:hypothetical protein